MNNGNIALGGILTECNEFSINLMKKDNFVTKGTVIDQLHFI